MHNQQLISQLLVWPNLVRRQGVGSGVSGVINLDDGAVLVSWDKQQSSKMVPRVRLIIVQPD